MNNIVLVCLGLCGNICEIHIHSIFFLIMLHPSAINESMKGSPGRKLVLLFNSAQNIIRSLAHRFGPDFCQHERRVLCGVNLLIKVSVKRQRKVKVCVRAFVSGSRV